MNSATILLESEACVLAEWRRLYGFGEVAVQRPGLLSAEMAKVIQVYNLESERLGSLDWLKLEYHLNSQHSFMVP